MTLLQIADSIIHVLEGGDPSKESQFDRRDIIFKIKYYAASLLKPQMYQNMDIEGDSAPPAQAIYSHTATLQQEGDRKFITLPEGYATLARNKGLHRVYAKGNPYKDFVPQYNPGITSNLPHLQIPTNQFYWAEGKDVVFGKGCIAKKADEIVVQTINPAPSSLTESDTLPASNEQVADIVRLIRAEYMPLMPTDYLNNQNTNSR